MDARTITGREPSHRSVILVGHGAPAADCPRELVVRLKTLESQRRAAGTSAMSEEERELDARVRGWPRTDDNDPYRAGIEQLARALGERLPSATVTAAYNEFCAPSLDDAVAAAVAGGAIEVAIVPSMLTPGGVHSEREIPEAIERLQARYPDVDLTYAWPFEVDEIAQLLAEHVRRAITSLL